MAKEYSRSERIGDLIHRELASTIHDKVKDPRLGLVTVMYVVLSRDRSFAKVYFSMLSQTSEPQEAEKVLNNAAGFLRSELAHQLKLKTVPKLQFYFDSQTPRGEKLYRLVEEAVKQDQEKNPGKDHDQI